MRAAVRASPFADVGSRLSGEAGSGVRPFASAVYRHALGVRASLVTVGYDGTISSAFDSHGVSAGIKIRF